MLTCLDQTVPNSKRQRFKHFSIISTLSLDSSMHSVSLSLLLFSLWIPASKMTTSFGTTAPAKPTASASPAVFPAKDAPKSLTLLPFCHHRHYNHLRSKLSIMPKLRFFCKVLIFLCTFASSFHFASIKFLCLPPSLYGNMLII